VNAGVIGFTSIPKDSRVTCLCTSRVPISDSNVLFYSVTPRTALFDNWFEPSVAKDARVPVKLGFKIEEEIMGTEQKLNADDMDIANDVPLNFKISHSVTALDESVEFVNEIQASISQNVSADVKVVASCSDGSVRLLEVRDVEGFRGRFEWNHLKDYKRLHRGEVNSAALSLPLHSIISTGDDNTCNVTDVETGKLRMYVPLGSMGTRVSIDMSNPNIFMVTEIGGIAQLIDIRTNEQLQRLVTST
jgi:WD40 repeat protein